MKPRARARTPARQERVSTFAARTPCPRKTSYSQECIHRLENFRDVTPRSVGESSRESSARETWFYRESRPRDAQRKGRHAWEKSARRDITTWMLSRGLFCKFVNLSVNPLHEDYPPKGFIVKLFESEFGISLEISFYIHSRIRTRSNSIKRGDTILSTWYVCPFCLLTF
jgi:hypothetical protein